MYPLLRTAGLVTLFSLLASCGGGGASAPSTPAHTPDVVPVVPTVATEYEELATELYVSYFGRPATPAELITLTNSLKAAAAPTTMSELEAAYATQDAPRKVLDTFAQSKEWKEQYPSTGYIGDEYHFVEAVYSNLFNSTAYSEDWEKYAGAIANNGQSRLKVALTIANSAKGTDAQLAASKYKTARAFTRALAAGARADGYAGVVGFAMARAMLQDIASAADSAAVQARQDAAIAAIGALASGSFVEQAAAPRKLVLLVSAEQAAQAPRLSNLATAMAADLNSRAGAFGPQWTVTVVPAAATAYQVRAQLQGVAGAILVGEVPVPQEQGAPALDAYRLPNCAAIQFKDGATEIISRTTVIENDPACRNGATMSVLRGTSSATATAEITRKLDQMIAYHADSAQANAAWARRTVIVDAVWGGGLMLPDLAPSWERLAMYPKDQNVTVASGSGAERRAAFLDCLASKSELCEADVHGAPIGVAFEGPGANGTFYSPDSVVLTAADLLNASIRAKYVEMVSCSTQNFLVPQSFGSTLLMRGDVLLTNGFVTVTGVADQYQIQQVINQYFLLNAGATFADAWLGQAEHGPIAFQGDPYITMRPVAETSRRPLLVVNGMHYNAGSGLVSFDLPDALAARTSSKLIVLSNRGTADLHVRIDAIVQKNGVDGAPGGGIESEFGYNAQYTWGRMLAGPEGFVYDPVTEQFGGRLPLTIRPGASVAVNYQLEVRTGADGKPKRTGSYTGEIQLLSDDPASARLHLALRTQVR